MHRKRILLATLLAAFIVSIAAMTPRGGAAASSAVPATPVAASGFTITSPAAGSLVPCGQPITVTWTGGNPSDNVNLVLIDVQAFQVFQGFGVEPNTGSRVVTIGPGSCGRQSQFYVEDSPRTTWTYGPVFTVACSNTFNIADGDVAGLIAAINSANASGCPTTINLAHNGTYTLTAVADNSPDYQSSGAAGLPYVRGHLTINGNGATIKRSTASGTPDFVILEVSGFTPAAQNSCQVGCVDATLTLDGVTLMGGSRGGLHMTYATANVQNSTITENTGGGINNVCSALNLLNSTVSYNTSDSAYGGGGIFLWQFSCPPGKPTANISFSTIYDNANPGWGRGNAIGTNYGVPGSVLLKNSILASPSHPSEAVCNNGAGNNLLYSLGHNILGDNADVFGSRCAAALTAPGDMINTNPLLGPLANNGGPTPTHLPLECSPAIDAVPVADSTDTNGVPITADQRGIARPQGAASDIGSVEVVPTSNCVPPPANMVSWWPGDGNARDIQGGNDGALANGVGFAPGKVGQAFGFDGGLNDFVTVQDNPNLNLTQALTIDAWVNPSGVNQHGGIVEKTVGGEVNTQYSLHVEGGKVLFRLIKVPGVDHRTIQSDSMIPTNAWTHVAGTWDGVTMKLFINGLQQAQTQAVSPPINSGVGPTLIGYTDVNPYAGLIDEVEIFNRALSVQEIRAIYLADSAGKCKPASDTTHPTVSCPSPITASADSNCQARVPNVLADVSASGGCGGPVTLSQSPAAGTLVGLGTTTITVTATDAVNNSSSCTTTFTVSDNTPPIVSCPASSTASADSNCQARVPDVLGGVTASDSCGPITLSQSPAAGTLVGLGTTTITVTATDAAHNSSTCTTTFTVTDNTPPAVSCPANIVTSTEHATCGAVVNYTVTASDNCSAVTVSSDPPSGTIFPKGTTTVNVTARDAAGNNSTCSFTVTVRDQEPPSLACSSNIIRLTDPGQCTAVVSYAPAVSDNCAGASVVCTPPSGSTFPTGTTGVSCIATDASGNTTACGFTVTVNNQSPVASINSPASGAIYSVGTSVSFAGSFSDNAGDAHTAQWSFVSNTQNLTQAGSVNETTGAVSTSYTFTSAGVYLVTLTVADQCGHTSTASVVSPDGLTAMVVIYDPNGGFVTGGGWIDSPAGAYTNNPALTGRASFGFVSRYERGATVPSGNTEFQFRVANFNFHSSVYEWLVVSGARAQYKGSGTVNGSGNYGFLLTAIDGQINGGGGVDKFRIKIWDKNNAGAIVYDNQLNAADSADPTAVLGGGSIVIQK